MDWLEDRRALADAHARSVAFGKSWMQGDAYRAIIDRLDAVRPGDGDAAAEAAQHILANGDAITALLAPLIAALADDPLFEPPFRVRRDPLRIGAVLVDHPAMSISAGVLFADALATVPPARTVVMNGRRSVVRYHRAAGAVLARWQWDGQACRPAKLVALTDGDLLHLDGRSEAHLLVTASSDVATVTATIKFGAGEAMREFARDDGAPVRTATLDDAVSRTTVLLTLLRLSGRADAGEVFGAASRHVEPHLRWAAMREWLALDVAGALPRLEELAAEDREPAIRQAASATLPIARQAVACPA